MGGIPGRLRIRTVYIYGVQGIEVGKGNRLTICGPNMVCYVSVFGPLIKCSLLKVYY